MERSISLARFDDNEDAELPTFICFGCGYLFDLPADGFSIKSCECGGDLCCDCPMCERCQKVADKQELIRQLEEMSMEQRMKTRNLLVCVALGII